MGKVKATGIQPRLLPHLHLNYGPPILNLSLGKLSSSLPSTRLINHLAHNNQPHPVIAFKPKPLSKDSTPEEFAIWKDNFEEYFTASNAHNCDEKNQSVFLNTFIVPSLDIEKCITDGMPSSAHQMPFLDIFNY